MPHPHSKLQSDCFAIFEKATSHFLSEKAASNYALYHYSLAQALALGYNSTIICPVLSGSAVEWAHFQAVIVNEITHFTNITSMPACLISGGPLDGSADRHQQFTKALLENIRDPHPIAVLSTSSDCREGVYSSNQFSDLSLQNPAEAFTAIKSLFPKNSQANLKLDLRIVLIG